MDYKVNINKKEKEFPSKLPFIIKYRTNDNLYLVSLYHDFDNSFNKIILVNIHTGVIQSDMYNCVEELRKDFELVSSEIFVNY